MKRLLFILSITLLSHPLLQGQIQKGAVTFEGALGVQQTWRTFAFDGFRNNDHSFNYTPAFAFMVSDHWLVGGAIGLPSYLNADLYGENIIRPTVRYYFNPIPKKNKYFVGFEPGFNVEAFDESIYTLSAGVNRFLNANIALDATANYSVIGDNFNVLSINLGLRPFLSRSDRVRWQSGVSNFGKGDLLINANLAGLDFIDQFLNFIFNPRLGVFLNDQFVIGMELDARHATETRLRWDRTRSYFSVAPFVRYYLPGQKHWRWFGEAGAAAFSGRETFLDDSEINNNGLSVNAKLGTNCFLTSNLALEISLRGSHIFDLDGTRSFAGSRPNINVEFAETISTLSMDIAVQYFLNRK